MYDSGHQHHHGVRKNIVEGIGGILIGAAAVLLLTRFLKGRKAVAKAEAAPAPAPESVKRTVPKRAAPAAAKTAKAPVAKRPSRARAKPAPKPSTQPESTES
jgi:hypothetical protein